VIANYAKRSPSSHFYISVVQTHCTKPCAIPRSLRSITLEEFSGREVLRVSVLRWGKPYPSTDLWTERPWRESTCTYRDESIEWCASPRIIVWVNVCYMKFKVSSVPVRPCYERRRRGFGVLGATRGEWSRDKAEPCLALCSSRCPDLQFLSEFGKKVHLLEAYSRCFD